MHCSSRQTAFQAMEVPTKTLLADVYPEDAIKTQTKRWNELIGTFRETYGKLPDFVSRSPGRVNLIGEVSYGSLHSRDVETLSTSCR